MVDPIIGNCIENNGISVFYLQNSSMKSQKRLYVIWILFFIYLDSFHKLFSRNLIAKVAKTVVFDIKFDLQFLITFIWTWSLFLTNMKVLI